jgi:sec-independent protein translocase protein TatA
MSLGPMEITLVVLVLLLLFGGRKIPELMRGLGTGMKEFKKATTTAEDDIEVRRTSERRDERYIDEPRDERYLDDRRTDDRRADERRGADPRVGDVRPGGVRPVE